MSHHHPHYSDRQQRFSFTADWFKDNVTHWHRLLAELKTGIIHVLEIGAFEGRSTTRILEELLLHPQSTVISIDSFQESIEHLHQPDQNNPLPSTEQRFYANIQKTGKSHQVTVMKNNAYSALIELDSKKYQLFDFIYIDGSHQAKDVLSDAVLAWPLLTTGGIIIFDDDQWQHYTKEYLNPKLGIDAFLNCYSPYIQTVDIGHPITLKKMNSQLNYDQRKKKKNLKGE